MRAFIALAITLLASGCGSDTDLNDPKCQVIEFQAFDEEPLCVVQCAGKMVLDGYNEGHVTTTVVSCSWRGKQITRSRR